jgi:hypothetical protein
MASRVATSVIDNGLASLKSAATHIYLTTQEPANYTEASSTYAKGNKNFGAGNVFPGAIGDGTNGRKVTTAAVTDGDITGDGTVTHWAITDGSALLATGALAASQAVTNGNTFSLGAFDITVKNQ